MLVAIRSEFEPQQTTIWNRHGGGHCVKTAWSTALLQFPHLSFMYPKYISQVIDLWIRVRHCWHCIQNWFNYLHIFWKENYMKLVCFLPNNNNINYLLWLWQRNYAVLWSKFHFTVPKLFEQPCARPQGINLQLYYWTIDEHCYKEYQHHRFK